ncbi:circadian clock KaiB family protein [Paraflavitalea pollutisoli]|uniref:circadian clock KaiB family protein n=1 Tax=Paraflavitalea pollutisoli TaxID=3034143 RepID=UPI0023ECC697|nr:circadian clock KaiB family protein [Paraflavitalea sp. H1-2-19X]
MHKKGLAGNTDKGGPAFVFTLYVTGNTPNSIRAINNIQEICETYITGQYKLDVVDVYQQPALAQQEQLIALPLLVKKLPLPERKLIGDLSDKEKVLKILNLGL